jgi:site-specific recombinase XerD
MEDAVRFIETPDANTDLGRRDRAIIEFLYATGIRVGELVTINMRDIDFRERMVRVTGKRKKQRIVPFHEHRAAGANALPDGDAPRFSQQLPCRRA